jgi:hypothetical protein
MLSQIQSYYDGLPEPEQGVALALRKLILGLSHDISEKWKYGIPFFYFRNKMFCYLGRDKKKSIPYLGIVEGHRLYFSQLVKDGRKRIRILYLDPERDLPIELIHQILREAMKFYPLRR